MTKPDVTVVSSLCVKKKKRKKKIVSSYGIRAVKSKGH